MWKFAKLKIETRDIAIPSNVLVPCPISGKQENRLAASCCPDCEFFQGLAMLSWADKPEEQKEIDKAPFHERYSIRCVTVAEWRLTGFK